ncbi:MULTISPECIES: hypothetical protein [unclassified Crossiella]|uniref:hypothetical protein n=1 Tax=unclassified Crossiella TaxID=2620835 RepID=UPI001FFEEEE9|nr:MULTISPECIES: hypothetical protein [unclassified Crossiella]MCK2240000.1 hypothetical protein [Crossiella sp. S99.2]MCK2252708.1 hypothetical protein [Crossiella sp. S99.1]
MSQRHPIQRELDRSLDELAAHMVQACYPLIQLEITRLVRCFEPAATDLIVDYRHPVVSVAGLGIGEEVIHADPAPARWRDCRTPQGLRWFQVADRCRTYLSKAVLVAADLGRLSWREHGAIQWVVPLAPPEALRAFNSPV